MRVKSDLDDLDISIIECLITGMKGKEISMKLSKPMSTVQRRVRKLFESGAVSSEIKLDFAKMGMKRGNLFIYIRNGESRHLAEQVAKVRGILNVSVHVGNSDVVSEFAYRDSNELLEFIEIIKNLPGVDKVVWSE